MKAPAILVLCLVALVGWAVFDLLRDAGTFVTIEPHFDGRCRPVSGMPGPEDVTIHPESGIAFVSSSDRRARRAGKPTRGAIYALDLEADDPEPTELTRDFDAAFEPHGISLFRDRDGSASLFVVSHPGERHVVEIFDVVEGALVHRETVRGELLRSPNDVFAVGRRQFYVTNDHRHPPGIQRTLEDFLRRAISDVVFFDGEAFRVVADGIAYPNGITGDASGTEVFVASTTGRAVLRYERDATGELTLRERFFAGTGVDNLETADDGTIWIGAHPKLLAFLANARDPESLSPSQVLSLDPGTGTFEEVLESDGADLSTSSAAAVLRSRLVVGSVFESHVLVCERGGAP
jgi:arylesterase/paraoxonase